jgi:hypothetical protein
MRQLFEVSIAPIRCSRWVASCRATAQSSFEDGNTLLALSCPLLRGAQIGFQGSNMWYSRSGADS